MKKKKNGPLIIIISILVLPVVVYGVFELNSLTVDESELEKIYERQLTSVLFTVNQTLQDKMSEITTQLERDFESSDETNMLSELRSYQFFHFLYLKKLDSDETKLYRHVPGKDDELIRSVYDMVYSENRDMVDRLIRYKEAGNFMKIEPGPSSLVYGESRTDYVMFILGKDADTWLAIYSFDANLMIEQNLGPKLQEIAQEDFILTCTRLDDNFMVYTTTEGPVGDIRSERLDLLPNYKVGIAREGGTVEEAVNRRKRQNLIALGLLMIVMIIGVGLVFRNIQREMALAQKKADFVSNVSHEIRTPLALINMFAETLLLDRVRDENKKKEYYGIISKEVARLTNMINRILSFSKIEANKRVYQKSLINLNTVISDVLNTYSYHLENNGFTYELNLADHDLRIFADQEALIEVLVNLIDNGMKYSQERKLIKISSGAIDEFAFVAIEDHGIGIAKGQMDKLFEKFYRVPTGDVHDTKGSGLGLTIVKHIMDAHGGRVEVSSIPDKGSVFKLFFPLDINENA